MEREMIRKAEKKDISRIAEILVFDKRIKYRPIFKDDAYCFGKLQILAVSEQYGASDALESILVYDDGIVKGLIRIEKSEIVELYVDYFFQNKGIGAMLIAFAIRKFDVRHLYVLEKNTRAIRFYQGFGFSLTQERRIQEGTTEFIVKMDR